MYFSQFRREIEGKLLGSEITSQAVYCNHLVQETADGDVFVDRAKTKFVSIEEAVEALQQQKLSEDIRRKIQEDLYEEMSDNKIASIIASHHKVRVTDTLIESYVELASSKLFTADPVALDIRSHTKLDRIVEGKIDYVLNDGTRIAISEATQQTINKVFGHHQDVIEYMRENAENFLSVLEQIED